MVVKFERRITMKPGIDELRALRNAGKYNVCPVSMEMLSDIRTPIEVMRTMMSISKHCYMLESAESRDRWGRYTFMGLDPRMEITCKDGKVMADGLPIECSGPEEFIRKILKENRAPKIKGMPSFTGGLVGYFSYDYIKYAEPTLNLNAEDTEGFRDVDLMLFDKVIAFDNYRQKIILIVNIRLDDLEREVKRAEMELHHLRELVRREPPAASAPGHMTSEVKPYFSQEQYCEIVERAKKHIYEGDIFQIVLSNRLEAGFEGSLFNTYRVLRTLNPSPYMMYFSGSDMEVAGASPETLVKLEDGILHTFPLAGTRPRGKTPEEDERLEQELLKDPKELAEHNMLVDLGRNDLGRICKFGTVKVEKYHVIEKYSHVMHIGSTVRGEIREEFDALDAVASALPAGTLSGAPKLRACQLINDLEGNKRGIYGGAIGYIDFTGNMDVCIAIRIAYKKKDRVFVRSGAGIVADSVPKKEYQECLNKAAAVVNALRAAEEVDL